jgi:c-di-GMP-binding flagellar brake protein YcgR
MKYKERRRFERHEFSYPVDVKIFAPDYTRIWMSAFLKNISMGGSCIEFLDSYGRISLQSIKNAQVKIKLLEPDGERMFILGAIRWAKEEKTEGAEMISMGIVFDSLPNWQVEKLEKFIHLQGKDHKMLWNLWDSYIHTEAV